MATEKLSTPAKRFPILRIPFSRKNTLTLFLVIAFPINFWAIIIWFRNIGSVAEENGLWDAVGVGAYLLSYALLESALIFLAILLLSLLLPKKWGQEKSLAQVSVLYLMLTIGLILEQSRALVEFPREGFLWRSVNFIINRLSSSPVILVVIAAALTITFLVVIHRSQQVRSVVIASMEKVALLSAIYLILDLAAIILVIIRNL
jgi:hypothetical protein